MEENQSIFYYNFVKYSTSTFLISLFPLVLKNEHTHTDSLTFNNRVFLIKKKYLYLLKKQVNPNHTCPAAKKNSASTRTETTRTASLFVFCGIKWVTRPYIGH